MTAEGKRACVIGAGFGGLALAIRLQAAGVRTTVIEQHAQPGGMIATWQREGFTFVSGPSTIAEPDSLRELWEITGHDMADDVELLPVSPSCRFNWPDGTNFDMSQDEGELQRQIGKLDAAELAGFDAYMRYASMVDRECGMLQHANPALDREFFSRTVPALAKCRAWRSMDGMVAKFIRNGKLREALASVTLRTGANPLTASATNAATHYRDRQGGHWWVRGGTGQLVAGMARQFERLGGTLMLGQAVAEVETLGTVATGVRTKAGWHGRFAAVASNADMIHTYRDLLGGSPRGRAHARKLARRRFTPSMFVVHFGLEGSWPGIPHHMVLFGPRFRGLLQDIYGCGVLPADLLIDLIHPSVTDPGMAPEGKSVFRAAVPVAHLGKLAVDWSVVGPVLERRILDEVGRRLIPDIHDRIVTRFHLGPRDFAADLNAHLGSAFGFEQTLPVGGRTQVRHRDDVIGNLYFVGAGTHPGAGTGAIAAGASITADMMLGRLTG